MKILHVCKKYPEAIGGDAFVVSNLEKQQKLSGNKVFISTTNCKEIKNNKNVFKFGLSDDASSLDKITLKRMVSLVILFFIAFSYLRKKRPDVIHTHSVDMAFFVSFAAKLYKIPIVHTFHIVTFNDPQQSFLRRNTELLFLRGTQPKNVIVSNPLNIPYFNKEGFKNVQFIPNGVNVDEWKLSKKVKKNSLFTFISVGRLEEQKGFRYLIEAVTMLKNEKKDFQVQIVGEGSQFKFLSELIEKNKLKNIVKLLGGKNRKQLKELYRKAHAFVLPSLWEEFPLTILEAWASKLPVIVSKVGAIPTISKDKVNALVIKPKNPTKLAYAMDTLVNNKELADMLSKNGYDEVVKKFDWKNINKNFIKVYEE